MPATLFWGDTEMDWDMLSSVAGVLNQDYHTLRSRFFIHTSNIRYLHQRFVEPDEAYDQHHNRGSFVYELHRARPLHAQDPRDHVYAFLGHFSIHAGSKHLPGIEADYSRPVEDVYVDVAIRDLRGADSLIMLSANHHSQALGRRAASKGGSGSVGSSSGSSVSRRIAGGGGPAQELDLPSWVPDWQDLPMHILGAPVTPHRAAGSTKPQLTIDDAERILHIRGIRLDTIDRHSFTFFGKAFQFRHDAQRHGSQHPTQRQQQSQAQSESQAQAHHQHHHHTHKLHHGQSHTHTGNPNQSQTQSQSRNYHHSHNRNRSLDQPWRQAPQQPQQSPPPPPSTEARNQTRQQQSRHIPQQQLQRMMPIEVLWRHICGYQSFTLSHLYPHGTGRDSAFLALAQTLTNACIGADRSRPYESIPTSEWLARAAAYLVHAGSVSASTAAASSSASKSSPSANGNASLPRVSISPELRQLAQDGDPFKWSHEATLVTRYRRFAVTSTGYYVLGPDAVQFGDVVVVLYGGKTPFLLRRDGSHWLLIGECYVHGLMNGEALDMNGLEEETFSIH